MEMIERGIKGYGQKKHKLLAFNSSIYTEFFEKSQMNGIRPTRRKMQ
jgi:hypothetical protein